MNFSRSLLLLIGLILPAACGKKEDPRPDRDLSQLDSEARSSEAHASKADRENFSDEILEISDRLGFEPAVVAEARSRSPEELEALTEAYVHESGQSPAYWELMLAKDLAAPYLIAVLDRDDAFTTKPGARPYSESPGRRALAFLPRGEHEAVKTILKEWLPGADKAILSAIDQHLTAFGSDDLLPEVKVLFEHEEKYIAGGARAGAIDALKSGRAQPEFKRYLWEHCVKLLDSADPPWMWDPIRLLVLIDEDSTREVLLRPEVLRYDHRLLAVAISSLNQLDSPPPAEFLIQLFEDNPAADQIGMPDARHAAISGLILHNHPKAAEFANRILSNRNDYQEEMQFTAWSARFKLRGLTSAYDEALEEFANAKYHLETLTPDQQEMAWMHYLDAEVRNGGLSQWYFNSFGEYAAETQEALERIGANDHAKIVAAANRLFGSRGPPKNREKREEQLDAMPESKMAVMDSLDEKWYNLPSWGLIAAEWDWNRQTKEKRESRGDETP